MTLDEKAKDLRSSGYVLTFCGVLGIILMALIFTGVIPLNLSGVVGIVSKLVMTLLFLVFLAAGISSLKRAGTVLQDAERENEKKKEIRKWFLDTYSAEDLDGYTDRELEGNDLYFDRIDIIKDKICERFMDVEDSLMSELTEEIYTELFDKEPEKDTPDAG